MRSFELYEPTTVKEAVDTLAKLGAKAKVLAGGSDLVAGVMKDWVQGTGMPMPEVLVDVTTIPQLRGIKAERNGITVRYNTGLRRLMQNRRARSPVSPHLAPMATRTSRPRR